MAGRRTYGRPTRVSFPDRDDITFRSGFEARVAVALDAKAENWEYEADRLAYTLDHMYTPDFTLEKEDGAEMYIEAKGEWLGSDRTKLLAVLKAWPGVDIRMVFQKAHRPLRKGSKTTYAAWCDKRGIRWAEGEVPRDWMRE